MKYLIKKSLWVVLLNMSLTGLVVPAWSLDSYEMMEDSFGKQSSVFTNLNNPDSGEVLEGSVIIGRNNLAVTFKEFEQINQVDNPDCEFLEAMSTQMNMIIGGGQTGNNNTRDEG